MPDRLNISKAYDSRRLSLYTKALQRDAEDCINREPTGPTRNMLTEVNMLLMIVGKILERHDRRCVHEHYYSVPFKTPIELESDELITVQEVWNAAGGNPGIKADREMLLTAVKAMDDSCIEASEVADKAVAWLRNNYQEHPNVASLCDGLRAALVTKSG